MSVPCGFRQRVGLSLGAGALIRWPLHPLGLAGCPSSDPFFTAAAKELKWTMWESQGRAGLSLRGTCAQNLWGMAGSVA